MFSCELQNKIGVVLIYVKASLNSMILQTEKIDNVDDTFKENCYRTHLYIISTEYY